MSNILALNKIPEVSFIDNLTLQQVQEQMVTDYCNKYEAITGIQAELPAADPIRLYIYASAAQHYQKYQYIDRQGKQNLLKYSYGDFLDNLAAIKKLERKEASYATTTIEFQLSGEQNGAVGIPAGTRISSPNGIYFATDVYLNIPAGHMLGQVTATALEAGTESNGVGKGVLNVLVDPIGYVSVVSNIADTVGGADRESDDDLTQRIYDAPASYSVAGPEAAYEYFARWFRADVEDAKAHSPEANHVTVVFMLEQGKAPNEDDIKSMEEYLRQAMIRPMCDFVTVIAPPEKKYNINLTYYINSSDASQATSIQYTAIKAIEEYKIWQRKIGRDISPDKLRQLVMNAGCKRLEITEPVFAKVENYHIATLDECNIIYGGVEDD